MSNHSIGTWLSLPNESVAEIFAKAGYEWVVIDLEHSAININQAEQLIRVIDLAPLQHLYNYINYIQLKVCNHTFVELPLLDQ